MPDVLQGKEFQPFKGLLTALRSLLFIFDYTRNGLIVNKVVMT